jgi:hypothetical protein
MLIDLKNCEVFLVDGNVMTGTVNLMAGYTIGATSIVVADVTGQIPAGSRIMFAGDDFVYRVVSTIETTMNTTTVVISPGLKEALVDNQALTAGTRFLKMKVGEGDIKWTETKTREYKLDRGKISEVRNGDDTPMDVTFQIMYIELTSSDPDADPPTPEDVLKQRGGAANWDSSDNLDSEASCRPFSVNIEVIHTPPCVDLKIEKVILPYFRYEKLDHDPKGGMISCSGKCNATEATVIRLDQE